LIESEFFGHEKGAFTGAIARKIGRFELAHSGTIFLDEIGDLPLDLQVKLLRMLQEQEFERVGSAQTIRINVRVIASTNRDLHKAVEEGKFRADLYYRLNVFPICIPPLRERNGDIALLAQYFVNKHMHKLGKHIEQIAPATLRKLGAYHWPGNVRELEHVVERAVIVSEGPVLSIEASFLPSARAVDGAEQQTGQLSLEDVERQHILKTLKHTHWAVEGPNGAALILKLHPNTLRGRMRKLGIKRDDYLRNHDMT
jgi:transcriptional regulator with GAF, ATPase, and Fis domain